MNQVWITRTRPAADESADVWRAAGFEPLVAPLLDIQSVVHEPFHTDEVLIFTSKNGVDHVACDGQRAICVGDATALHARKAGFKDVVSVDGASADVTKWVRANLKASQAITHISGWHVRGSIVEDLQADGYLALRKIVYRSVPRSIWPDKPTSCVAFYSPLSARTFTALAKGKALSDFSAVCISQATADELIGLELKSVVIASRPREDELIVAAKSV